MDWTKQRAENLTSNIHREIRLLSETFRSPKTSEHARLVICHIGLGHMYGVMAQLVERILSIVCWMRSRVRFAVTPIVLVILSIFSVAS